MPVDPLGAGLKKIGAGGPPAIPGQEPGVSRTNSEWPTRIVTPMLMNESATLNAGH
jgi:hypothetical protein